MLRVELIIPACFVECVVHVEGFVVDAFVVPLAVLVEQEHLFRVRVRVDHIEIKALVLLEEWLEAGGAPVIVLCNRNHLACGHEESLNAAELQSIELNEISLRVELHSEDEAL